MSTLRKVEQAIEGSPENDPGLAAHSVMQRYRQEFYAKTGRNCILYVSGWMMKDADADQTMINDADMIPFIELASELKGKELDLIIHSPGGVVEVAGSLVRILRGQFDDIRVIVPHLAMSAATMVACAADKLVMANHSFLGPTDPQMNISGYSIPARALVDEFSEAQEEVRQTGHASAYDSIHAKLMPGQLTLCRQALIQAEQFVAGWLGKYMFKGEKDHVAASIAKWLIEHHMSHSRYLSRDELREKGLFIEDMEEDKEFRELVMSLYYSSLLTIYQLPNVCKLIVNSHGSKFFGRSRN